jgi:hypothetical protein
MAGKVSMNRGAAGPSRASATHQNQNAGNRARVFIVIKSEPAAALQAAGEARLIWAM